MPKLDRNCIIHAGYLWKSPPLEKRFLARWKRRWFVLYDTVDKPQDGEQRELELIYFECEEEQRNVETIIGWV